MTSRAACAPVVLAKPGPPGGGGAERVHHGAADEGLQQRVTEVLAGSSPRWVPRPTMARAAWVRERLHGLIVFGDAGYITGQPFSYSEGGATDGAAIEALDAVVTWTRKDGS